MSVCPQDLWLKAPKLWLSRKTTTEATLGTVKKPKRLRPRLPWLSRAPNRSASPMWAWPKLSKRYGTRGSWSRTHAHCHWWGRRKTSKLCGFRKLGVLVVVFGKVEAFFFAPELQQNITIRMSLCTTLLETNSSQLKMDFWNTFSFPFGSLCLFSGVFTCWLASGRLPWVKIFSIPWDPGGFPRIKK